MTKNSGFMSTLQRLSPRERGLAGATVALMLVIGLSYGVLTPGLAAAHSAADRNEAAARELNTARELALSLNDVRSEQPMSSEALKQSAEAAGLVVISVGPENTAMSFQVSGPSPNDILAWIAGAGDLAVMRSVTIEPNVAGGTMATIVFAGLTQ